VTHDDVYILYIKIIIFKDPYWIIYIYIVSDDSLFISCRGIPMCSVFSYCIGQCFLSLELSYVFDLYSICAIA
jgi:hypothetical protein